MVGKATRKNGHYVFIPCVTFPFVTIPHIIIPKLRKNPERPFSPPPANPEEGEEAFCPSPAKLGEWRGERPFSPPLA
jgi:hypothetical protein